MSSPKTQNTREELSELLLNVGVGVWEWDIPANFIRYSDEYLRNLGYSQNEVDGTIEEWKQMNHPKDLPGSLQMLEECIVGKTATFECEMRMRCKDGTYVWIRDVGEAVERDEAGTAIRLMGACFNIDELKHSKLRLTEALETLENKHISMENAAERHNIEMAEQGKLLWTVSQISRRLLMVTSNDNFDGLVRDCLHLLGESIGKNRVYIWKDRLDKRGRACCTQIYEWARGVKSIQGDAQFEQIPYADLPAFDAAILEDRCLNSLLQDLSDSEKAILGPQGIKTILIAPVTINGKRWGFIGVDNCEDEQLFTSVEENMLMMSGSLLANAIEKMDTEAAMREMEARTQIMLNAMPLCCNLWTPDFQNMSCNDEAVRLFKLSSQQEYLEKFYQLSPEYQPSGDRSDEMSKKYIMEAFQKGYCRFEWLHQRLDNTLIPAEITLVRIKYKEGFIVAGYTRDLREQKAMLAAIKTKDALRMARDEALLNSKAKSNFLANMSHEIRTPMNAISGFAEIIMRESGNEKTSEYARGIKNACDNLINIVNDILDISKIESGKLEISNAPYDVASLLNDVIAISRMRLGDKPLMFITNIDSHLPACMVGDEIRIRQILLNILSNAIKYTNKGFIELCVFGTVREGETMLSFSVKDSGVGIKEEDLESLFEEFERVNTKKNRSIEGTGLGLAISKQLCEMMGGHIKVESVYGKGSEFVATIPQKYISYERLAQVGEPKTVLLYEPRDLYRGSIAKSLENLDCRCVSCANQSELYENIGKLPYDYVLTASLYQKKIQTTISNNKMSVPIAVFADCSETLKETDVYTILFPVNCLQLSDLLNGEHGNGEFTRRSSANIRFIAPLAKILVVDDSPVNLQVAKGLMEPYQFMIDTAQNGVEAIEKVKNIEYDLVFMDHMMPEMDGVDATIAIRKLEGERFQALPIIALTANALVGTREMFIREGMNDFLAKPIETGKLARILIQWLPQSKIIKAMQEKPVKLKEEILEVDIVGVDTVHGINAVGGNRENYLQILSAYYADGRKKCASLLQHRKTNDIKAFRTEVHAIKSTSATIGAQGISDMAKKLEDAAQREDFKFIDRNVWKFLTSFQEVLDAIGIFLDNSMKMSIQVQEDIVEGIEGDSTYLEDVLESLADAAEFANISQIEEGINKLQKYAWLKEVAQEILTMEKYAGMFDYDGVLECIERIKETSYLP